MALLTVRITSEDGTVRELKLEPGTEIEVAEGDKVEILDSEGRPIEILADGDNVIVTIVAEQQQTVIIDGIVRGGGEEEEEFIFENLALYIEDETGSSIAYFDPDTEEVFLPSIIACRWHNYVMTERKSPVALGRMLKQRIDEGQLKRLRVEPSRSWGRGFVWVPEAIEPGSVVRRDIEKAIANTLKMDAER
ncbi:MAG: hypothetical protein IIA00_10180 [Proteobacteria bacterium]|nr:hypothetical protein [Pseudomonadota bacterium]